MVFPRPPRPPQVPSPPTDPREIALLRVLLDDVQPPQTFTDAGLALILTLTDSMFRAAALGWRWKGVKLADPNRLIRGTIGNETLEFPSLADLKDWLDRNIDLFDGLADRELFPLGAGNSALWLRATSPSFFGVSGPYSQTHPYGGPGDDCIDVSRMGLHGVTGAGHAQ